MAEELYKGSINEYTEFDDGSNSFTGASDTGGLKPSGGSIRELLQKHIRNPFVVYDDVTNGLYRLFSSDYTKSLWLQDPEENSELELFNFERPTEYSLSIELSGSRTRYLRQGDSTQTGGTITYTWLGKKGSNEDSSQTVTATYTITDKDGNTQSFSQIYDPDNTTISVDIYSYLKVGENIVTIAFSSDKGASTSLILHITLLQLEVSSTFNFNRGFTYNNAVSVPVTFKRNITSADCALKLAVDGTVVSTYTIAASSAGTTVSHPLTFTNAYNSDNVHVLQVWAELSYNGSTFTSNVLYYTFETKKSTSYDIDAFINVGLSLDVSNPPIGPLTLTGVQYEEMSVDWGYFTNNDSVNLTKVVIWKLVKKNALGTIVYTDTFPAVTGSKGNLSDALTFTPTIYSGSDSIITLEAYDTDDTQLLSIDCQITKSAMSIYETEPYIMKISATGKTNSAIESERTSWTDTTGTVDVDFTNIPFDSVNGWSDNAFRTSGVGKYATINFCPLGVDSDGYTPNDGTVYGARTIEFEFESEKVSEDTDVIIKIGNENEGHIVVTPNSAILYDSSNVEIVKTNFKANERVKLCFIINPLTSDVNSQLVYIVDNGVIERAASLAGKNIASLNGKVVIGNSNSGVKFYSMRVYYSALTYTDAFNNFVFDSSDKTTIVARNNILKEGEISYDLVVNKIDTIVIKGDLSKILNSASDQDDSETSVSIERNCPSDKTKNFSIDDCMARKHGQSTLRESVTSIKFWLNKTKHGTSYENSSDLICQYQAELDLNKKRYVMKDGAIPANKFVLQANYADSSGVNNAVIEQLINDTWYNALVETSNGRLEYVLRTDPQLFSTNQIVHHDNSELGETGSNSWTAGYNSDGKQWNDYFNGKDFPYDIRIAPDSFPCAVFYIDTSQSGVQVTRFLGMYVFMDDKKSDYCYGERSIYNFQKDPFCLTVANKSGDKDANRIWNNKNVLQLEVLNIDNPYVDYTADFSSEDPEDIVYDDNNEPSKYRWEEDFELIFQDEEDIEDDVLSDITKGKKDNTYTKYGTNSEFRKQTKPFVDWLKWICGVSSQSEFESTASQHLDLYKMAAYYIFMLRFGLADSGERNVQIRCYDGVHFAYYPWDMDIAIGKMNTGPIAYDPPMTRQTQSASGTYAISGHNNKLWNYLEGWDYWMNTIVPKVAKALWSAGLQYDNFTDMFDNQFSLKWAETIYNISQYYKYISSTLGASNKLTYLQGSAMPYRHWWTSISDSYYNAFWKCGDFMNHEVYVRANKDKHPAGTDIVVIKPTSSTFFMTALNGGVTVIETFYGSRTNLAKCDISAYDISTKVPFDIYGANMIEELDLSCFASEIEQVQVIGTYSTSLGAVLKVLDMGAKFINENTQMNVNLYGISAGQGVQIVYSDETNPNDALSSLQTLNVRGLQGFKNMIDFYNNNRQSLTNVYAAGSGLQNFYSSKDGNDFDTLELPDTVTALYFYSSRWNTLEFYTATQHSEEDATLYDVVKTASADGTTYNIPATVRTLCLNGSSAQNLKSIQLIRSWIANIEEAGNDFGNYTLVMDNVNWSISTVGLANLLTYEELAKIAQFNNGNSSSAIKGYVVINTNSKELTTAQLNNLSLWFGNSCFTLGSDCLVIDCTTSSISISASLSDPSTGGIGEDGNLWMIEGSPNTIILRATQFRLGSADGNTYNWTLVVTSSSGNVSTTIKSQNAEITPDGGVARLKVTESTYGDRSVRVRCSYGANKADMIINIKGVTYPNSIGLMAKNTNLRVYGKGFCYYKDALVSQLDYYTDLVGFTANYKQTASLKPNITVKLTNQLTGEVLMNETNIFALQTASNVPALNDDNLYMNVATASDTPNVVLGITLAPEDMSLYMIELKATFVSGKVITSEIPIAVLLDENAIINNLTPYYEIINTLYYEQLGVTKTEYFKVDLLTLTGTFDVTTNEEFLALSDYNTRLSTSVFKYLTNIDTFIFDGSNISDTSEIIDDDGDNRTFRFENNTKLKKISMRNCANITSIVDIDISKAEDIEYIDSTGTKCNFILADDVNSLAVFKGGTISKVNISDAPLKPDDVSFDNISEVESVDLVHDNTRIQNSYCFTILNKLI